MGSGTYAIYREAPVVAVRFNDANKIYDTQAFTGGAGLTQVSGFVNGDPDAQLGSITYSGTSQGAVNANTYVISGTVTSALGYSVSYTDGALTVGKANLTLSGTRIYDAGTTYAGQFLTATGVAGETFSLSGQGDVSNLASPNVQSNQTLSSVTGLALGTSTNGGLASNYNDISTAGSSVSVTPRTLTVIGTNNTVTYNGSAQTNSGATITGQQGNDSFTIGGYAIGTQASTTAYADNLSLAGAGGTLLSNYTISYTQGSLTIGKAIATVTANSGSVTYNSQTQSITGFTASGLVGGETEAVLTGVTTSGGSGRNAGSYTHTASGTDNNYELNFVAGSLNIGQASATVNGTATNLTYNGTPQTQAAATSSGFFANDDITITGLASGLNAGTYTSALSVGGTDKDNYHISITNADLIIDKAILNLVGTRAYDAGTSFAGQYLVAMGVAGETFSVLGNGDASNLLVKNVQSQQPLNSVTGLSLGSSNNGGLVNNYNLLDTTGSSVSVTPINASVTATGRQVTYDASVHSLAAPITTGFIAGDDVAFTGLASGTHAGTYTSNLSAIGSDAQNYNISITNADLVIDKAHVVLTGTREYDASTRMRGADLLATGVAGETFSLIGDGDDSNLLSANVQTQQTLNSVTGLSLDSSTNGGLASNYHSLSTLNSSVDVTPRTLTVDAVVADKTFDGTTTATVTRLSSAQIVSGDDLSLSHTSANFSDSNASTAPKTVTVAGISLSGSAASNYQLLNTQTLATAKILLLDTDTTTYTNGGGKTIVPTTEPRRPRPVYPWEDGVPMWRPMPIPSAGFATAAPAASLQIPEVPFTTQDTTPSSAMCLTETASDCVCELAGAFEGVSVCFTPPDALLGRL